MSALKIAYFKASSTTTETQKKKLGIRYGKKTRTTTATSPTKTR
jgi:hypothetical protein